MEAINTRETKYRETIKALSDRIVDAQRPIRILDAIKWDANVRESFFTSGFALPAIDASYYQSRPLGFEADAKRLELEEIARDIRRHLGQFNPLGQIMERMCREYIDVVRMLEGRGTAEFSAISRQLYGSSTDAFHAGEPTLGDMATLLSENLDLLGADQVGPVPEKNISGEDAVTILQERLTDYFADSGRSVRVKLSDDIVSDAAAGADYIKLRKDAWFSTRDLRVLEIHEGWVHLGTTVSGLDQPICTFLGKGAPSSTVTQEGLAVLMEIFSFASHPGRVRRLTDRVHAVRMAEEGADFVETFRAFVDWGATEEEAWNAVSRVYRGSAPTLGPFTKDLCYSRGFILIYNFIRAAVKRGIASRIRLLFCGKSTLEDIRTIADLVDEGIVEAPRFVPPPFDDLNAVCAWMTYANFLDRLDLDQVESDYANLLA